MNIQEIKTLIYELDRAGPLVSTETDDYCLWCDFRLWSKAGRDIKDHDNTCTWILIQNLKQDLANDSKRIH